MPSIFDSLRIDIIDMQYTTVTNEWDVAPLQPDAFTRLYLVEKGVGAIQKESGMHQLQPGQSVLIPSGTRFSPAPSPGFGHYWIHFTTSLYGGLELFDIIHPLEEYTPNDAILTKALYGRLLHISQKGNIQTSFEAQSLVRLLLSPFIEAPGARAAADTSSYARFTPALTYIDSHLSADIAIGDLAEITGICSNYFSNLFTATFGTAPRSYIIRKRIERAQLLLWTTLEPLKRIASLSGFNDLSYFSHQFKRITGITPGYYRLRQRSMHPKRAMATHDIPANP